MNLAESIEKRIAIPTSPIRSYPWKWGFPHLEPAAKERIKAGGKSGGKVTKQARTQKDPALKNDISTRSSAIAAKEMGCADGA